MKTSKLKENVAKTSQYLSHNAKPLLIGGAVMVGLLILYKVYRAFSSKTQTEEERIREQQVQGVIGQQINEKNLTISQSMARNFAQQLLDAMDYMEPLYGTDEQTILKVFKQIKTKDDFLLVFNAFGMKDYNGNGLPPTGVARYLDVYEPRNLVYWLKAELSPRDKEVYDLVKKVVENAGFVF